MGNNKKITLCLLSIIGFCNAVTLSGNEINIQNNSTHDVFWTPSGHDSCQAGEICNVPVGKSKDSLHVATEGWENNAYLRIDSASDNVPIVYWLWTPGDNINMRSNDGGTILVDTSSENIIRTNRVKVQIKSSGDMIITDN